MVNEIITLLSGDKYEENFEKKKQLGKGKFGVVFEVEERVTKKVYAAKHIKTRKRDQKEKVLEEIGILANLSDPHIMGFVGAYENRGEIILVMEYLDGGELFEKVANEEFEFPVTETVCSNFMRQICLGLSYLHSQSIVHLDLKPENIVCVGKEANNLKLIDFGLAKKLDPKRQIKVMAGTPEFLSPEVVNFDPIETATDMWSVGVICYVLLSGFSPFLGETDSETFSNITSGQWDFDVEEFDDISDSAKNFVSKLLIKKTSRRLSATQSLSHEWLLETEQNQNVIKTENLKKYLSRRRWQKCGKAIHAMQRMSNLVGKGPERPTEEVLPSPGIPLSAEFVTNCQLKKGTESEVTKLVTYFEQVGSPRVV